MVERSWIRRLAAIALVFMPLIIAHPCYIEWNRSLGVGAVVTTISLVPLFAALTEAADYDPAIFSGSTSVDEIGRLAFEMTNFAPLELAGSIVVGVANIVCAVPA
jgi:hypothetical protein